MMVPPILATLYRSHHHHLWTNHGMSSSQQIAMATFRRTRDEQDPHANGMPGLICWSFFIPVVSDSQSTPKLDLFLILSNTNFGFGASNIFQPSTILSWDKNPAGPCISRPSTQPLPTYLPHHQLLEVRGLRGFGGKFQGLPGIPSIVKPRLLGKVGRIHLDST